jgi:hypothetical protein
MLQELGQLLLVYLMSLYKDKVAQEMQEILELLVLEIQEMQELVVEVVVAEEDQQ